jgi:hypothetical protein
MELVSIGEFAPADEALPKGAAALRRARPAPHAFSSSFEHDANLGC